MLDAQLSEWLDAQAQALDQGQCDPQQVLARLAGAEVLRVGIDPAQGGSGGDLTDALEVMASVASHSLAAAFVCWGQRAFIEYLLHSPNAGLRQRLLPSLLSGELAGATGLSNAMKFLSGIEALQVRAREQEQGWSLNGRLHWVTNLRKSGFVVAAAIEREEGGAPFILAIPDALPGLQRSDDLQLMALQSSNTAALELNQVAVARDWLLHEDARVFLPAALPSIATGLLQALAFAWVTAVGSELFLSSGAGLGNLMMNAEAGSRMEVIVLCVLCIGLCGYLMTLLLTLLSRRLLRWRPTR
ncbi:ABC transporter permease subunit [Pseudomonas protegens]|uniref:ABC transporter permease subunit n=1 Tax=Pseudomonas protegens TaxID=380021 RepID=UPI001FF0CE60|nr:ABC transporter permease subunit [Pseudomonas protegens]